jgi:hypothetical protein
MLYIPGKLLRPRQMRAVRRDPRLSHISLEEIPSLGFLLTARGRVPREKLPYPLTVPKKDITKANKALAEWGGRPSSHGRSTRRQDPRTIKSRSAGHPSGRRPF